MISQNSKGTVGKRLSDFFSKTTISKKTGEYKAKKGDSPDPIVLWCFMNSNGDCGTIISDRKNNIKAKAKKILAKDIEDINLMLKAENTDDMLKETYESILKNIPRNKVIILVTNKKGKLIGYKKLYNCGDLITEENKIKGIKQNG